MSSRVVNVHHEDGRARRGHRRVRRRDHPLRVHRRHLVDADRRAAARRWTRPSPTYVQARGRRAQLPRLPDDRAGGARGGGFPRQLDLRPLPRASTSAASRTSARGRPTSSRRGARASGSSTSSSRATHLWTMPDDELVALGKRELQAIGLVEPGTGRDRLRRAHAEGLSDVRRAPTPPTSRSLRAWLADNAPNVGPSAATGCTSTTTRTTRCTPPCSPSRTS